MIAFEGSSKFIFLKMVSLVLGIKLEESKEMGGDITQFFNVKNYTNGNRKKLLHK